jgi:hypothetical protein
MGRSDGTLEACDAPADQAGSATLSVTGKRLGGAVMEEIMEPALVPALRNFAHFREINELGCPTRKHRLGASSSSRARLIRRAIKPRSPAEREGSGGNGQRGARARVGAFSTQAGVAKKPIARANSMKQPNA